MSQRWPIKAKADASILRQALQFPTSKRTAKNRIFKVALTECLSSYDEEHIQNTGLPTQKLNNVYSKWGVGGFGMVFTGNIFVDPKHMEYRGNSVIHPTLNTEERKDAFKKSTEVMKKDGALAIAQLNHAGRLTPINFNEHPFAPSGIKHTPLIKPSVKNAVVLLSGGLRTVYGMADVISNNIADGVGLGKPSMAEPDVAKKLLSNQYQSVVYNHLEDDYQLYVKSCMKQLNEAAATPLEETDGDLTYGITDFSDKEIAEEFKLGSKFPMHLSLNRPKI
uniref:NADH:flavin oxidoreductase/NADH oxidase N-terminal domain-containing protein n=1 Tax=Acrobeloides nanus TaxID=290746 RepID=A0A914CA31_9BILA